MGKRRSSESEQDRQYERAVEVLKKHWRQILHRKGVTGVDVNYRVRDGQQTDEIVIRVQVSEKLPIEQLHHRQIITEIEGVPVDIVERQNDYEPTTTQVDAADAVAPVINQTQRGAGTFGVTCKDKQTGELRGLTNAHVVFAGFTKTSLPAKIPMVLADTGVEIGSAIKKKSFLNSELDCALIEPANGIDFQPGIPSLLTPPGRTLKLKRKHVRKKVKLKKLGAKTNLTEGVLSSITQSFSAGGTSFMFQIAIQSGDKPFSAGGDSGSVIIFEDAVVGLLHGLSDDGQIAIACHIDDVVDQLEIKF